MSELEDLIAKGAKPGNILDRLILIESAIRKLQGRETKGDQLSEISDDMGVVQSGEFRCGNGEEPGDGFSGVRMGYPGFEYGGETYNLVGLLLDALQFGLRATDGAALFAGGKGTIDLSGINLIGLMYALRHYATDLNGNNPRYGRFEMILPDGKTIPALALTFLDATPSEALGTNRGFELGDFSQWTKTTESHGAFVLSEDNPQEGTYCLCFEGIDEAGDKNGVLTSDRVNVTGGNPYEFSCFVRNGGATVVINMVSVIINWYDAASSGNLLRQDAFPIRTDSSGSWQESLQSLIAPGSALSFEIVIGLSDEELTAEDRIFVDNFTCQNVQMARKLYFDPNLMYQDVGIPRRVLTANQEIQYPGPKALYASLYSLGDPITYGSHSYKVTFVDSTGGETPGGAKSNVVTNDVSHKSTNLAGIPIGPTGTAARKIYRTVAGDTGDYYLVAAIEDNTTTTYTDTMADGSLGAAIPKINTTEESALLPVKALVRWEVDVKSNLKAAGVKGAWNSYGSVAGPYAFVSYGADAANSNNGDWFEFDVYLAPGTYTMLVHHSRNTNRGKLDFYENDAATPFASGVDLYGSAVAAEVVVTGCVLSGYGVHHIRAVVNGKNGSSSDYMAVIADVEFVRE